jgi:hypothetical protein
MIFIWQSYCIGDGYVERAMVTLPFLRRRVPPWFAGHGGDKWSINNTLGVFRFKPEVGDALCANWCAVADGGPFQLVGRFGRQAIRREFILGVGGRQCHAAKLGVSSFGIVEPDNGTVFDDERRVASQNQMRDGVGLLVRLIPGGKISRSWRRRSSAIVVLLGI